MSSIRINPPIWIKLFDDRRFMAYSKSAIGVIGLDWKMQQIGRELL